MVVFEGGSLPRKSENSVKIGKNRPSEEPTKGLVVARRSRSCGPLISLAGAARRASVWRAWSNSLTVACSNCSRSFVVSGDDRFLPIFTDFYRFFGLGRLTLSILSPLSYSYFTDFYRFLPIFTDFSDFLASASPSVLFTS